MLRQERQAQRGGIGAQHSRHPVRRVAPARPGIDDDVLGNRRHVVLQVARDRPGAEAQHPFRPIFADCRNVAQPKVVADQQPRAIVRAEAQVGQWLGKDRAVEPGGKRGHRVGEAGRERLFAADDDPAPPG